MKKVIKTVALATGILVTTAFSTNVSAQSVTVQSGDSLWKLAQTYNVSIDALKTTNHLNSNSLFIGQTLTIPTQLNHSVQSGESLWIISQKYNVTIQELISWNNLSSTSLYVGQTLQVGKQTTQPVSGDTYTVQSGDTLWIISQRFNVTIDQLVAWNSLSSHNLSVGQKLTTKQADVPQVSKADEIIQTAKQYIGVPYVWGGSSPAGFDCSGYLQFVLAKHDVSISRTVSTIYAEGTHVSNPQRGDLVFFETYKPGASHAGIYLGNDKFIHASSSKGITISSMNNTYWKPRYIGAKSYN